MKKDIIGHLEGIIDSIEDDIIRVVNFHKQTDMGGYHSVPRLIFCYVDYLGSLVFTEKTEVINKDLTKKAVKFIQDYFPRNFRYKDYANLLYKMWRHGTVHEYDPKVFLCSNQKIAWCSVINSKFSCRKEHLNIFHMKGQGDSLFYINCNMNQLADDLLSSAKLLLEKCKSDIEFFNRLTKNFNQFLQPLTIVIIFSQQTKKAIQKDTKNDSELFDEVQTAFKNVDRGRVLNKNGETIAK